MTKKIYTQLLFCFVTLLLVAGCVKYDALPFEGHVLPRRSGYVNEVTNDWIYYNLRTGQIFNERRVNADIKEGEQQTRMDWDLAFCGFILRTNGGTSGKGQGAAADLGFGNYEQWTTVSQLPTTIKWITDEDNVSITMSERDWVHYCVVNKIEGVPWFDPNLGPQRTTTNANPLLANALTFTGPPPVYTPSFHTYVVRTADGKQFFKLQVISWFDESIQIGETGGKISFYCDELK